MTNTNITNFRNNVFDYINQAVEFNDVINVSTKNGNAVILSEEDYNGLMETLYLSSNPQVKADILEGAATPLSECVSESDIEW
ncbi:MAG: type II toxin-antitoxin system Phd/YefM family antitoxin [Clostridia bacterium]|nr:type II toxin-antitoxin system Phd/YefM family antitoxin [Clostridia bacterium]